MANASYVSGKKTSAEIRSSIGTFSTNRDALRDMAHGILMDILIHAALTGAHVDAGASGDTTLALAMLKEMPKSWAEQARAWFDKFSPIRVIPQTDKSGMAAKYKNLGQKGTPEFIEDKTERDAMRLTWWKLSEAAETPFYKVIDEPEVKTYGLDYISGIIDAQIKVLTKKLEDNKIKPEAVASAHAMIARLNAAKILSIQDNSEAVLEQNVASEAA